MTNEEPLSVGYEPLLSVQVQLDEVLAALETKRGALVFGRTGSGKTTMLYALKSRLEAQGRPVFLVNPHAFSSQADLDTAIRTEIESSPYPTVLPPERTLRSSTGGASTRDTVNLLQTAGQQLARPVLLLDDLGASRHALRLTAVTAALINGAPDWSFVIAAQGRPVNSLPPEILRRLLVIELGPVSLRQARAFLQKTLPHGTSEADLERLIGIAQGNRLLLRLLADAVAQQLITPSDTEEAATEDLLSRFAYTFLDRIPGKFRSVLELLAIHGALPLSVLTQGTGIVEDELSEWLQSAVAGVLISADDEPNLRLSHPMFVEAVFRADLLRDPFSFSELYFGSEEAERDDLLDATFVVSQDADQLLGSRRTIVIGDRGAGKSALFRRLRERPSLTTSSTSRVSGVSDVGSIMQRITDKSEWRDAETLRAAWLIFAAAATAAIVPEMRDRGFKRDAAVLEALVQPAPEVPSFWKRALRTVLRPFAGTNLKFAVGPMTVEAQLPGTAKGSRAPVDVEAFLSAADRLLSERSEIAAILVDRVDEASKYDRPRQEAFVQALLQAESRMSLLKAIRFIVFLRRDLFELYDIQEKNKLVSRTLSLDWSTEDWLTVLLKRVLINEPLHRVANRCGFDGQSPDIAQALSMLFPGRVEDEPFETWLIDGLRNGNGEVSPRLAVLFLHLARDAAGGPGRAVRTLPLFDAPSLSAAMDELSALSFSEVVNDFKVAPTFVLNCRAGRLTEFAATEVADLFSPEDGPAAEQVQLLERLGFLERVVVGDARGTKAIFRIPRLYTRSWYSA